MSPNKRGKLSPSFCYTFPENARTARPNSLTNVALLMYDSCMSKTITIDDDVYKLLSSLKQDRQHSFTKVLRRHVHKPAETDN
jgi:hypothetical protein